MKSNALAFLALATTALPAHGASPEFKVELFSNRIVKSISVEAPRQGIKACDPKFSSSCVELAPESKISCLADRGLRCQLNLPEQTFTGIRLESPQAFRLMATFLKTNEPT